ncbi:Mut7-C RNAse domain-containing protein, partial [Caballeronia mineralivorans]|uniref:Mut7-C RNAse domain-containing protein n=1 Tax=Caballeronia mineralivorans TaxID=2010198 RepID=UPI002AFF13CC
MTTATFRFHRELNEFLARPQREQAFACVCPAASTTKHMIEALGVPHTEVTLILRNGVPTGFDTPVQDLDFIDVYPPGVMPRVLEIAHPLRAPLRLETLRFIADAHLGALAHLLRLAGFDTRYDNHFPDDEIEQLALTEHRVVLTRDRELLKRRTL